ncbi:MAG: hypothetical protein HOP29_13380 [Phycisphaerales bacterium]|nr:hypothetical protein [Phycisphaerales bacterium]
MINQPPSAMDRRTVRGLTCAGIALVLCVHAAGRIGAYCSPLRNDSYIYASFGYRIAQGDVLYRDMSDIKPPGLFLLYAMNYLVLPPGRPSLVPVESLFLIAAYYAVYRIARDFYGPAIGVCASIIAAVTLNYFTVMGYVIEGFGLAENFMVLPAVAAIGFYMNGRSTGRSTPFVLAGVLLAWDAALKQSAVAVIAAVGIHQAAWAVFVERSVRKWAKHAALIAAGAILGALPFIVLLLMQGTFRTALELLTRDAGAMIARGTAWPATLADIRPLALPLAWCGWALVDALGWTIRRTREPSGPNSQSDRGNRPTDASFVGLLLIWCLCEASLIALLPLRSAHYYVAACPPFILLTGSALHRFSLAGRSLSPPARCAASSIALVISAALYRPVINESMPVALSRWKSHDAAADRRRFDDAVNAGRIHFGRGAPFVEPDPNPLTD